MKLISTGKDLHKLFIRLMKEYDEYFWASAWASRQNSCYDYLLTNKKKIKQILVGTHFYQTDPEFIFQFIDNSNVRFIWQADGTFHPKQYLFQRGTSWEMFIGSPNFTAAAFRKNTETGILISDNDPGSESIRTDFINLLNSQWELGKTFQQEDYHNYLRRYRYMKQHLVAINDGVDPDDPTTIPTSKNPFLNKDWKSFYSEILRIDPENLEDRIALINEVQSYFERNVTFAGLTEKERGVIASLNNPIVNGKSINTHLFGSIRWFAFKGTIAKYYKEISEALEKIPIQGYVMREDYMAFIDAYREIDSSHGLASPTRLLAMKRPDVFFCLTSANQPKLFKAMNIQELNDAEYWDVLISQIRTSDWYNSPEPSEMRQLQVWKGRAAFMDCLFYQKEE